MATKKAVKKLSPAKKEAARKSGLAAKQNTTINKIVDSKKKAVAKKATKAVAKAPAKKVKAAVKDTGKKYRFRSAGDGELISKAEAEKRDPNTVVRETIKPKAKTIAVTPAAKRKSVIKTAVRAIAQSIDNGTGSREEILAAAGKKITTKYKS